MRVLIIDHDEIKAQIVRSKLEGLGHRVEYEPMKDHAVERLVNGEYGIIFLDPSPMTSARPVVVNIRRTVRNYPYIFLMSDSSTQLEAIQSGVNDLLEKPVDPGNLEEKVKNAVRLRTLINRIGNDSEDFPSAGGVIAKSAFNQLFRSAIERADRYGEKSYVLFISISNYQDIIDKDGPYPADFSVANLSQKLVHERRQSDIIGQTAKNEYALLLQRPTYDSEPIEAADRFAESLSKCTDIETNGSTIAEISVELLELPTGALVSNHWFKATKPVE